MLRAGYDVLPEGYEELYGEEQAEKYEAALSLLDLPSLSKVLDAGCGIALLYRYLRGKGFKGLYVGIDIDLGRLRYAAERLEGLELIQADAEHLPFRSNSFDLVASFTVIHLLEVGRAVGELLRVSSKWVALSLLKKRLDLGRLVAESFRGVEAKVVDTPWLKDRVYLLDLSLNEGQGLRVGGYGSGRQASETAHRRRQTRLHETYHGQIPLHEA